MGRHGRPGRSAGSNRERKKSRPAEAKAEAGTMSLIEVAESMLLAMRRKDDTEPRQRLHRPKGSLLSAEWIDVRFVYDGRRRKVSVPTIVLRDASRDFQLGCIFGALAQKVVPRVHQCRDCGRLHEPEYTFSGSALRMVDEESKGGGGR